MKKVKEQFTYERPGFPYEFLHCLQWQWQQASCTAVSVALYYLLPVAALAN